MTETAAVLDGINPTAFDVFAEAGVDTTRFEKSITVPKIAELTDTASSLSIRSGPAVPAEAMGENLQVIGVYGSGVNHIDRRAADERGIVIFNAPHDNTRAVAELVIFSSGALLRGIHLHDRKMQAGIWSKSDGQEMRNKTIGILGYGAIGLQVAGLADAMSMNVVYYDPAPQVPPQRRDKRLGSVEEVLEVADIVTPHIPGGKGNHHLIDASAMARMKKGSYLISDARAELVDYDALIEALDSDHLAGAAVDVYTDGEYTEPAKNGDPFDHKLRGHPKVLCLPHIGGSTEEAQQNTGTTVASKIVDYLRTGSTMGAINVPNLALNGLSEAQSRLLNIHSNLPGVLSDLTSLIGDHGLNIASTYQKAAGEIGYVAFDIEGEIPEDIIIAVKGLQTTRRVRAIQTAS